MRTEDVFPLAVRAVAEFQDTLRAAQHLACGPQSDELDVRMKRAKELLSVLDEALHWLDPNVHKRVFEAVPPLHAGFDALRAQLRRN